MIPAMDLWQRIAPQLGAPLFHEDNQATIMVINSGRNPTMRHIGRVHGVSVAWLHERLGQYAGREDKTVLFYESTENMSADIYTKSFKDKHTWKHALKLISIFSPADLRPAEIQKWLLLRQELGNSPPKPGETNTGWSKEGQKRQKLAEAQRKQSNGNQQIPKGFHQSASEKWIPQMDE